MRFKIVRFAPLEKAPADDRRRERKRVRGMGDLVAAVAHPLAGIFDRVFATHLQAGCKGCADRQKWLNETLPFPLRTPSQKR